MTTEFGLTLSCEEHDPRTLVDNASKAEQAGFDFVSISDHFHPWLDEQGHSAFVWSVLGAIAERTATIRVGVGVTCPIMRIHPAILAQATATTSHLLGDRFSWGVGTGEALNEHILGNKWPIAPTRLAMLDEAVALIRELWSGESVTFDGEFYTVENARIYDAPEHEIPIVVSAFGPKAAELSADIGDGLWMSGFSADTISTWRDCGGTGSIWSQIDVCWADDETTALDTVERVWRSSGVPGQLSQDLPTPHHFDQAASIVRREDLADKIICGPDADRIIEQAEAAIDAGVDHVYFHQIGPDQQAFLDIWQSTLRHRLGT